ncbi:conserved hypothetical protein [Perkinsus marinus ATCC 50983]|uniref:Sec20 C-terminal domain-containing protein n=1 Tax=Perkinsus marinus (strain ATCC 50983 / TXsc) TaxID=423536 RepID=C5KDS3_PERM5|nr:conserved hypothetical protein [Perkinsus marinus ATCC 50983]EER17376.1 conserved hypothetical protein [Perkinsus marinus ATCC 50983]|eukprot:XP_002785580.1 conserved hypothetical protein [Perkinsus marinus ATCC 50983]
MAESTGKNRSSDRFTSSSKSTGSNGAAEKVMQRSVQQMRENVERMRLTEGALVDSSGKISDVNKEYADNYSGALKTASEAMTSLKRKIDTDDKFIWWSFIFFIAVCVFIILKRLMIFSLSAWVLAMISKPIMFGYREVVEPVYRTLVGDTEVIPGVEEL